MRMFLMMTSALLLLGCGSAPRTYETLGTMNLELARAKANLAGARSAYGDAHPDVKKLQARVDVWKVKAGDLEMAGYRMDPCRYAARLWLAVARLEARHAELAITLAGKHPQVRALVAAKKQLQASAQAASKSCPKP